MEADFGQAKRILLAEDNHHDVELTLAALDEVEVLPWFTDGETLDIPDAQDAPAPAPRSTT